MVVARIGRWLSGGRRRIFDALQVEITTHCLLRCTFCPHETLRSRWTQRHMPMATFERLVPSLSLVRFLHLQGWGEPLLHPEFFRMVELGKAAGCEVGLTTNGVLLDEEVARRLVGAGVDLVAVSIAGATPSTHDAYRVGSRLEEIVEKVAALTREKRRQGAPHPRIVLLYMMLRSNVYELPAAVDLGREVGAERLVATNLDYVGCEAQDVARAFSVTDRDPVWLNAVEEAGRRASGLELEFRAYPLRAQRDVLVCEPMASSTAVVAADGGLFPCVYLSLPVDPIPRLFGEERHELPRRPFGSVLDADLLTLWEGEACRAFRRSFELRRTLNARLAFELLVDQRSARESADRLETTLAWARQDAPLPDVCRSCYKAYGL